MNDFAIHLSERGKVTLDSSANLGYSVTVLLLKCKESVLGDSISLNFPTIITSNFLGRTVL
jgi:hypothetical protein